jgi:hypothetical protein
MGLTAVTLGFNAKLYRNTASYASPTWLLIDNCRDLKLNLPFGEADANARAGAGWEEKEPALIGASVEFEMLFDVADANYTVLEAAAFARTAIEFAVMNGAVATTGNRGLRATCKLFDFSRDEPLSETLKTSVKIMPCRNVSAAPAWFVVP